MGALDVRPVGLGGEERAHQHLAAPIQLFPWRGRLSRYHVHSWGGPLLLPGTQEQGRLV